MPIKAPGASSYPAWSYSGQNGITFHELGSQYADSAQATASGSNTTQADSDLRDNSHIICESIASHTNI